MLFNFLIISVFLNYFFIQFRSPLFSRRKNSSDTIWEKCLVSELRSKIEHVKNFHIRVFWKINFNYLYIGIQKHSLYRMLTNVYHVRIIYLHIWLSHPTDFQAFNAAQIHMYYNCNFFRGVIYATNVESLSQLLLQS